MLKQILDRAEQLKSKGQLLAVFDLDSTLFDVSPRTQKILQDFTREEKIQKIYPMELTSLEKVNVQSSDWGVKEAIKRTQLKATLDFFEAVREYWIEHFFSDFYLHYDHPYDGAVEFVQNLARSGAKIIYLTGRDIERMGKATPEVLNKWKFPIEDPSDVIMKPKKGMSDSQFKLEIMQELHSQYPETWFFENEPANILLIEKHLPTIKIIFFDSTHSGRADIPFHLPKLKNFRY